MAAGRVLADGLVFPEGPRWRAGRLYLSDMHDHAVLAVGPDGARAVVHRLDEPPSGLGWLPDGRLLVVAMTSRQILVEGPGGLVRHADLSALASGDCNDMVVDDRGRAYVGNFGFDLHGGAAPKATDLVLVDAAGFARIVARDLMFPNGAVITPDGGTLIIGETFGQRLTAFTIDPDGGLRDRRVFADLGRATADGICLDAEGAVWVASPRTREALRVAEGGAILDRIKTEDMAIACMLGGDDGRDLFVLTAPVLDPDQCRARRGGKVIAHRAPASAAGRP